MTEEFDFADEEDIVQDNIRSIKEEMKEFNLSDAIEASDGNVYDIIEDVKEFIKLDRALFEDFINKKISLNEYLRKKKKLAGDKLTKEVLGK